MRRLVWMMWLACSATAAAQEVSGPPGPRLLLERAEEVALARSAAPESVSGAARVWYFDRGTYVVADSGSNGIECYVSRSWPLSLEPQCFDPEGAQTIMKLEMRAVEWAHAGVDRDEAARRFERALAQGEFRLPARPVMSWMMSAAQVLYSDNGTRVGAWKPHVMIYSPSLPANMLGTTAPNPAAGMVVNPGKATSNLMLVMPSAVQPKTVAGT